MARYDEFRGVCSIRAYRSNVAETFQAGIEGYIGKLEWYLGIADLIGMYSRQGIQLWVSIADYIAHRQAICT